MRTGIEILRDCHAVLHVVCGCDRVMCHPCAMRREVREYLDVADGRAKRRALAVLP